MAGVRCCRARVSPPALPGGEAPACVTTPAWWPTLRALAALPSCLCPDVHRGLTAPWVVSIPWGTQAAGCWHVPLVGTGGIVLGLTGTIALVAMLAEAVDEREGFTSGSVQDTRCRVTRGAPAVSLLCVMRTLWAARSMTDLD